MRVKKENSREKNRAVAYARYSSDNQSPESIDAQLYDINKFATSKGLMIVDTYIDKAKSGKNDDREAFQKMILDSKNGEFDFVVVHKIDRFARNTYDHVFNEAKLEKNDVRLLSVIENFDGSDNSKLMKGLFVLLAEHYSRNLGTEVMKGLKNNARNCKHTGGAPPLGYDVDKATKMYVINKTEAEIVRIIFKMYTSGHGYKQIMNHLNSLGYKTKFGKPFGSNSLHIILKNEKYTGTFIYNLKQEKGMDGKRRPRLKSEEEVIRVENGMPQIISKEMFEKAQLLLEKNTVSGGKFKAKEIYLLSGFCYCGICGASMYGNSRLCGRGKTKYVTYRCSNRAQHKGCSNKELNKIYLENFVLDELYTRLFNDNSVKTLAKMLTDYNAEQSNANKHELESASKELKKTDREISNIWAAVRSSDNGGSFKSVQSELKELEAKKEYLESCIKELTTDEMLQISEEMIQELIEKSKGFIRTKNIAECLMFIESYIEKVLVFSEHVEVHFKIKVPSKDGTGLVPLVSSEKISVLQTEYKEAR